MEFQVSRGATIQKRQRLAKASSELSATESSASFYIQQRISCFFPVGEVLLNTVVRLDPLEEEYFEEAS